MLCDGVQDVLVKNVGVAGYGEAFGKCRLCLSVRQMGKIIYTQTLIMHIHLTFCINNGIFQ